jgi:predicted phosphodiesterase
VSLLDRTITKTATDVRASLETFKRGGKMKSDFELIVHKLKRDLDYINIYPMCEPHIGSPNFSEELFKKWIEQVKNDDNGYVVIAGDLFDNALKNSKSNSYEAKKSPQEALDWAVEELRPIKDKILGIVSGNHEDRSVKDADMNQLYMLARILGIENVYRPNMAFLKVNLGSKRKDRQVSYTMVLAHGQSRGKTEKFSYVIDGMDVLVTGHIHSPMSMFPSKIVIDSHNEVVRAVGFSHVIVPSFQKIGGYTLSGLYMPQDSSKVPMITFSGKEKEVSVLWK